MSTTSLVKPIQCKIGDVIRFKTISAKDLTIYSGTVIGLCNFENARIYGDIASTHLEMENATTLKGLDELIDITEQTFLVVKCYDGVVRPFAFEWLQTALEVYGYVEPIELGATYTLRLYNVDSTKAAEALTILRENGFVCKLIQS